MENLLHLPSTTIVDKPVPKNAFFNRAEVGKKTMLKDFLTREFEAITWLYKLTADTLNVEDGRQVHEIAVFHYQMKDDTYSINPFCVMDKLLPRHTLFVIEHGNSTDILMHHKERMETGKEVRWTCGVTELRQKVDLNQVQLTIDGRDMDAVYTSLLGQIAGLQVESVDDYKQQVAENSRQAALTKQIEDLEQKARREAQPRRKYELVQKMRQLEDELSRK